MIVGLIGVSVVVILGSVVCLQFTVWLPRQREPTPTAITTHSTIAPPSVSLPTVTPGPPGPKEIRFTAEEPIKGFSDCDRYGFWGKVLSSNGTQLRGVQIVVWEGQAGLLALSSTDAEGSYLIEIEAKPAQRKLWLQVFENDLPVSQPVIVETQPDCQDGFQVYQIDWRKIDE